MNAVDQIQVAREAWELAGRGPVPRDRPGQQMLVPAVLEREVVTRAGLEPGCGHFPLEHAGSGALEERQNDRGSSPPVPVLSLLERDVALLQPPTRATGDGRARPFEHLHDDGPPADL